MRPATESSCSAFNFAMCVAAFAVVALVVMFIHPSSRPDNGTATATAGKEVAAAAPSLKSVGATLSGRGASQ